MKRRTQPDDGPTEAVVADNENRQTNEPEVEREHSNEPMSRSRSDPGDGAEGTIWEHMRRKSPGSMSGRKRHAGKDQDRVEEAMLELWEDGPHKDMWSLNCLLVSREARPPRPSEVSQKTELKIKKTLNNKPL